MSPPLLPQDITMTSETETALDLVQEALKIFHDIAAVDIGESEADEDHFRNSSRTYALAGPVTVGDVRKAALAYEQLAALSRAPEAEELGSSTRMTSPASRSQTPLSAGKPWDLYGPLADLTASLEALISESDGVYGLHRNGDIAPWDELLAGGRFEDWLRALADARRALDSETAYRVQPPSALWIGDDDAADAARYRHLKEHHSYYHAEQYDQPQPREFGIQWEHQDCTPARPSMDWLIDQEIAAKRLEDEECRAEAWEYDPAEDVLSGAQRSELTRLAQDEPVSSPPSTGGEGEALIMRVGERIADEVEKVAAGRQSNCEQAARDIVGWLHPSPEMGEISAEQIAKIVDPIAFKQWQSLHDHCVAAGDDAEEARKTADWAHKATCDVALEKADQILKLKENGLSREELGGLARSLPSGDAQERSPVPPLSDGEG